MFTGAAPEDYGFGKRGLRFDSEVVDCRVYLGLAGRMGLLAFLDAPIPSYICPRADRDNKLDCCVRRGVLL